LSQATGHSQKQSSGFQFTATPNDLESQALAEEEIQSIFEKNETSEEGELELNLSSSCSNSSEDTNSFEVPVRCSAPTVERPTRANFEPSFERFTSFESELFSNSRCNI
jgi:hypothetical protein